MLNKPLCCLLLGLALGSTGSHGASLASGKLLFSSYCYLCHGSGGKGDGRMAKLMETKPANLSISVLEDSQLAEIIRLGGKNVGRSVQMPAWGDQFDDKQITSLILFINNLKRREALAVREAAEEGS